MKKLTIQEFQNRLNVIYPQERLKALSWNGDKNNAMVQCLNCNTIYIKKGGYFLDKRKKSICKNCFPTQSNKLKTSYQLPLEYQYIQPYAGMQHKILIKHKSCGFIWAVTPTNIKLGKGCPKCNKKISKGEQKIINWLNKNNIRYISQYKIIIDNHNLYIDFYLPDYNLFIEYNGEQHYFPIKHFGGYSKLQKQKELDNLKRNYLKNRLLEIPYTYFDKIELILESSTTIPFGSTLQAEMAMEVKKLLNN